MCVCAASLLGLSFVRRSFVQYFVGMENCSMSGQHNDGTCTLQNNFVAV